MSEETQVASEESAATTETTEATVESNGEQVSETTYLDGKYKSVSELENAYKELNSTFSKKTAEFNEKLGAFTGAPEEYELPDGVEPTPRVEAVMEWAKDKQFSNEALAELIEIDAQATEQAVQQYVAEQKELLGKDADARLENLTDWAKANIGEDYIQEFKGMITSAKGVEMMEKLMKTSQGTAVAQAPSKPAVDADTVRQMRFAKDEFGNRKMSTDPKYRAKVEALEAEISAR